jgi:DNA-binding protein HU-beta
VRSITDGISDAPAIEEGKVSLSGFGTFSNHRREAHMGRNPMTGEPIRIAARNADKFKAGKKLKEMLHPPGKRSIIRKDCEEKNQ